jgi:hypothetical protein
MAMPYLVPIASSAPDPTIDLLTHATLPSRVEAVAFPAGRCAFSTRSLELST